MCPLIGIPELQSLPYTPGPSFSVSSTGFRFPESSLGIWSPGTSPSNDLCGLPGGPWQAELKLTLGTGDSCGQHPQTYDRRTAESSWATVIVCLGEGGGAPAHPCWTCSPGNSTVGAQSGPLAGNENTTRLPTGLITAVFIEASFCEDLRAVAMHDLIPPLGSPSWRDTNKLRPGREWVSNRVSTAPEEVLGTATHPCRLCTTHRRSACRSQVSLATCPCL